MEKEVFADGNDGRGRANKNEIKAPSDQDISAGTYDSEYKTLAHVKKDVFVRNK